MRVGWAPSHPGARAGAAASGEADPPVLLASIVCLSRYFLSSRANRTGRLSQPGRAFRDPARQTTQSATTAGPDRGLDLEHLVVDGCITKAPYGGQVVGPGRMDRR
jgi:hypothetical protein